MTYNKYLTEGVEDGTISGYTIGGMRCLKVRAPLPNEEVVGYTNFSEFLIDETITQKANREGEE